MVGLLGIREDLHTDGQDHSDLLRGQRKDDPEKVTVIRQGWKAAISSGTSLS